MHERYLDKIFHSNIPPGWKLVQLDDVCHKITDGTHKTPNYLNTGVRFISIKNIRPFKPINLNSYEKYISEEEHKELINRCRPEYDDILFPRIGTLGFAKRIDFEYEVSIFVGLGLLKPIKECISPAYLEYWMNHPFIFKLSHEKATGSGRLTLPLEESRKFPVPLPPLNEQHRIVAKIEELFSELDKGVESLTLAREQLKVYRQALLKDAFTGKLSEQWRAEHADQLETADQLLARIKKAGEQRNRTRHEAWESKERLDLQKPRKPSSGKSLLPAISEQELSVLPPLPKEWKFVRLTEIAQIGSGMSVSKNRKLKNPIEVPYLRVANVQRGILLLDEVKTMQIEQDMLDDLKLEKFDVLFNEGGDRDKLGRGWIWESQIEPCITQNHVFRATTYLGGEHHAKFISHWGNTFGRDYFDKGGKQTTNLASINRTVLSLLPVPLPPIKEQEIIINEIDRGMATIDSFEKDIEDALSKAEALRQAILTKAFSGQLVPQDPNDEPAATLLARIKAERDTAQQQPKKQPRKGKIKKERITMADLMEVMKAANVWLSAQEAFRRCGIADGAETEAIETIYAELRGFVKGGTVTVERRGQEDWLRLAEGA